MLPLCNTNWPTEKLLGNMVDVVVVVVEFVVVEVVVLVVVEFVVVVVVVVVQPSQDWQNQCSQP